MKTFAILIAAALGLSSCILASSGQRPDGTADRIKDDSNSTHWYDFGHCQSDDSRGDRYDCHQDHYG